MISNSYKGWFFHVNKSLDVLLHDISYIKNKMKKKKFVLQNFSPWGLGKKGDCSYSEPSHSFAKGV